MVTLSTTTLPALLERESDRPFRSVVETIWRCAQRITSINALLAAQVGLSPPQYSIIMTLTYETKGISVSSLAERLAVSQPFITREINNLVKAGLVSKRANPDDGRGILLSLSKKGSAAAGRLISLLQESNDILFQNVTREDFILLKDVISKIAVQSEIAHHYAQLRFKLASQGSRK
jgi:MarR family transcriptional regulator, organic hydroperoxide resistance regulator